MKRIVIFLSILMPAAANAAALATSCPAGFVAVDEPYLTIEKGVCPSGYTSADTANSCLISSPAGSCMMYAPAGITYTDDTGSYQFTEICPLS